MTEVYQLRAFAKGIPQEEISVSAPNVVDLIGKIKKASQGQFTVTNRDSNTPYIKNVCVVTSVDYYLRSISIV